MKKITVSIVTMLAALALTAPGYAAGEKAKSQAGATGQQTQQMSQSQSQSAEDILGMSVVAQDGEDLGQIQDLRIDTRTGRINYVTVQKGGVMGIGGEQGIPVPLEAFQFTDENARLTVDKNKLDNAPQQAGMSDQEFQRNLHSHYGISPAWQEGTQQQPGMSPQMRMESETPQQQRSQ